MYEYINLMEYLVFKVLSHRSGGITPPRLHALTRNPASIEVPCADLELKP